MSGQLILEHVPVVTGVGLQDSGNLGMWLLMASLHNR